MDLMRVQGRWAASARLAYVRVILQSSTDVSGGKMLTKTAPNTFPLWKYFLDWEEFFESSFYEHKNNIIQISIKHPNSRFVYSYTIDETGVSQFESSLAESIARKPANWGVKEWKGFIHHTVRGFLRADLFTCVTEFQSRAEGSFGLQIHSTLEPGVVVITSKGQPMSVSYDNDINLVLFGSEAAAVAVQVTRSGSFLKNRIDLNSKGEVMRIGLPSTMFDGTYTGKRQFVSTKLQLNSGIEIRSYLINEGYEVPVNTLISRISVIRNPPVPYDPKVDLVAKDLQDIPKIIKKINEEWEDPNSDVCKTALNLWEYLLKSEQANKVEQSRHIDLLLCGVEGSLWIAEQFASDFRRIFPSLIVATESSNKMLNYGGHEANGIIDTNLPLKITEYTCVLLISQSGQTFGTLHATRLFASMYYKNVWILTGCVRSKMETALEEMHLKNGEQYSGGRVFDNFSGNRPAEPTSVAIVASIYTLTKILLFFTNIIEVQYEAKRTKRRNAVFSVDKQFDPVQQAKEEQSNFESTIQIKINLTQHCIHDINSMTDNLSSSLCDIVGYDAEGFKKESITNSNLTKQGKLWGQHISEPWNILVLVGFYIFFSVGLNLPIFGLTADVILRIISASKGSDDWMNGAKLSFSPRNIHQMYNQSIGYTLVGLAIQLADAVWFIFIGKIFTWLFRYIYNRPLWSRMGRRTCVIVDNSCIHQLTESFVSKLFSQSYSFISIDVHGGNGLDHFVHRFTHRVARGLLLAVGRPDGRLSCLSKSEATLLLSCKQAAFIQNPAYHGFDSGFGPEIVTIGHNPYQPSMGLCHDIVLSSKGRGDFVDQVIYSRLFEAAVPFTGAILKQLSNQFGVIKKAYVESKRISMIEHTPMKKTAVLYGAQFIDLHQSEETDDKLFEQFLKNLKHTLMSQSFKTQNKDPNEKPSKAIPSDNPSIRAAFCSKLDSLTQKIQDSQVTLQYFYESRVASLERYVAFCVMFHAMCSSVNKPLIMPTWDMARSQSNLRVATTASPVTASSGEHDEPSRECKKIIRRVCLKKYTTNF